MVMVPNTLDEVATSPDERYIVFHSYPADDCEAPALWVVNIKTARSAMVAWGRNPRGSHRMWGEPEPVAWLPDGSIVFADVWIGRWETLWKLTLDPKVLKQLDAAPS